MLYHYRNEQQSLRGPTDGQETFVISQDEADARKLSPETEAMLPSQMGFVIPRRTT